MSRIFTCDSRLLSRLFTSSEEELAAVGIKLLDIVFVGGLWNVGEGRDKALFSAAVNDDARPGDTGSLGAIFDAPVPDSSPLVNDDNLLTAFYANSLLNAPPNVFVGGAGRGYVARAALSAVNLSNTNISASAQRSFLLSPAGSMAGRTQIVCVPDIRTPVRRSHSATPTAAPNAAELRMYIPASMRNAISRLEAAPQSVFNNRRRALTDFYWNDALPSSLNV